MTSTGDNCCPVCRTVLWAPKDETIGQRVCPRCGAELWALVGSVGPMFFPRRPGESERGFLARLLGPLYNVSAEEMEGALRSVDDLDLVELVMEVEEALRSGHH
jgi:hypothetical protein